MTMLRGGEGNAPGFMVRGRADNDRAFRGATRHSRLVRILRLAIPVCVALCLLAIAFATFLNPLRFLNKLPADFGSLVISGTKITMEQPRLAGFTRDSRAYELTAKAAAQDLSNPSVVELKEINAKLGMQDKSTVQMSAAGGLYDTKTEMLTLGPNIFLSSSTGYEGHLIEAQVDIRKGNIVSEKPVEVRMLKGNLTSDRLEVLDAGDLVRFEGNVSMRLMLEASDYPQVKPGTK